MEKNYDVIVIGAGSVGLPIAYFLTLEGRKVLVLEAESSVGQGQNKTAIGGVRATHSDPAKILVCQESLKIFGRWEETYGYSIGWKKGGYCFPVYRENEETTLKSLLPIQKNYGLNIDWIDANGIKEVIPGINTDGLIGGTYSPDDGQVSPLLAAYGLYKESAERGCIYHFKEAVRDIKINNGTIKEIFTDKGIYNTPVVVNAAGAFAGKVGKYLGLDIPVIPDSHEAGISAPMEQFLGPLNRSGHELREIRDKQCKVQKIPFRIDLTAIDINGVTQGLKGIKGYAHRQDHVQCKHIRLPSYHGEHDLKVFCKEVEIFKKPKQPQIHHQTEGHDPPFFLPSDATINPQAAQIVHQGADKNKGKKSPIPTAIEDVTGQKEHSILLPVAQYAVGGVNNN